MHYQEHGKGVLLQTEETVAASVCTEGGKQTLQWVREALTFVLEKRVAPQGQLALRSQKAGVGNGNHTGIMLCN